MYVCMYSTFPNLLHYIQYIWLPLVIPVRPHSQINFVRPLVFIVRLQETEYWIRGAHLNPRPPGTKNARKL